MKQNLFKDLMNSKFLTVLSFCAFFALVQGAPAKTSVGFADFTPTNHETYGWLWTISLQLSTLVGNTQADFAKARLGDQNFDNYVEKIPGIPGPIWNPDRLSEETLLNMEAQQLFLFADHLQVVLAHESQVKDNQFVVQFQDILDRINFLITYIQNVERLRSYHVTHQTSSPPPTLKPTATPKEQDEQELGMLKELLYWLIPVTGEFHRRSQIV